MTDENIVGLYAALLAERRVLLTASKLSTVRRGQPGGRGRAWLRPWGRGDGAGPPLTSPGVTEGQVLALPREGQG